MAKLGTSGTVHAYSFPLPGRFMLIGAANLALPSTVTPIENEAFPAGWSYLGPTEKGQVKVTLNRTTTSVSTGSIPVERARFITAQSGQVEANFMRYELPIIAKATGMPAPLTTGAASPSRAYQTMWYGGTLGGYVSLLVVQDWNINLVSDDNSVTAQQDWYYTPLAINDGDMSVSDFVEPINAVAGKWGLFGYNNAAAGDRDVILQHVRLLA
jgi:hypothetical protein